MRWLVAIVVIATGGQGRTDPTKPPPAAPVIAKWSSAPGKVSSPACITGGLDRFTQYADLDEHGAPRFCTWWNLKGPDNDVGCWRVDLASGAYVSETGVWFSSRQPGRVGTGGGAAASPSTASTVTWRDVGLEVCRGTACKRLPLARPDPSAGEIAVDATGQLAVVPLGPSAKARTFATIDVVAGKQLATLTIPDRHTGAEAVGFAGPSLVVTDCDDRLTTCTWDLYDPRTGARIAAVGGATPLGAGGTADAVDATHFAAVAGSRLVIQDAATGKVTAKLELPRPPRIAADYVVFHGATDLILIGPDGRVVLVDPATGKLARTITPPKCTR